MRPMSISIISFAGSQVRQQKMDEKSRFGELSTEEEIKEIMDNAVPITTHKARKFG